jgi:hypothetical protein
VIEPWLATLARNMPPKQVAPSSLRRDTSRPVGEFRPVS